MHIDTGKCFNMTFFKQFSNIHDIRGWETQCSLTRVYATQQPVSFSVRIALYSVVPTLLLNYLKLIATVDAGVLTNLPLWLKEL